jgi:hypothetical protein
VSIDYFFRALVDHMHCGFFLAAESAMLHTPRTQRQEHGVEPRTFLGPMILVARRVIVIEPLLDETPLRHVFQTRRQQERRHAGLSLNLVEAVHAERQLSHDQQRPSIAHYAERAVNWTEGVTVVIFSHRARRPGGSNPS